MVSFKNPEMIKTASSLGLSKAIGTVRRSLIVKIKHFIGPETILIFKNKVMIRLRPSILR